MDEAKEETIDEGKAPTLRGLLSVLDEMGMGVDVITTPTPMIRAQFFTRGELHDAIENIDAIAAVTDHRYDLMIADGFVCYRWLQDIAGAVKIGALVNHCSDVAGEDHYHAAYFLNEHELHPLYEEGVDPSDHVAESKPFISAVAAAQAAEEGLRDALNAMQDASS